MHIYPDICIFMRKIQFFPTKNECPSIIPTPPEDSSPCLLHRRLQDQVLSGARAQVPPSHCLTLFPEYQEHKKTVSPQLSFDCIQGQGRTFPSLAVTAESMADLRPLSLKIPRASTSEVTSWRAKHQVCCSSIFKSKTFLKIVPVGIVDCFRPTPQALW